MKRARVEQITPESAEWWLARGRLPPIGHITRRPRRMHGVQLHQWLLNAPMLLVAALVLCLLFLT